MINFHVIALVAILQSLLVCKSIDLDHHFSLKLSNNEELLTDKGDVELWGVRIPYYWHKPSDGGALSLAAHAPPNVPPDSLSNVLEAEFRIAPTDGYVVCYQVRTSETLGD